MGRKYGSKRMPAHRHALCQQLLRRHPDRAQYAMAVVGVDEQCLYVVSRMRVLEVYPVSTSRFGTGTQHGSYRTPLGTHRVAQKIGAGARQGSVFKARVNTNKTPAEWGAGVDFICSRILWLDGLEYGHNSDGVRGAASGKQCDSYRRYIYIHGTGNERTMIYPASYGCVRMSNNDVCEVFEMLSVDSLVYIAEDLPKTHRRFNISQVNDNIEHTTGTMK